MVIPLQNIHVQFTVTTTPESLSYVLESNCTVFCSCTELKSECIWKHCILQTCPNVTRRLEPHAVPTISLISKIILSLKTIVGMLSRLLVIPNF